MRYYFSAGFKNIEGIARNTGIKQGDFRGNINVDLSKTVTLAVNLSGSLKENNMMGGGDTKGGPTGSAARTAIDISLSANRLMTRHCKMLKIRMLIAG